MRNRPSLVFVAAALAVAASALAPAFAHAQQLRTVVVPADAGVVVAPRSAPPRLAARPPSAAPVAGAPSRYADTPGPVLLPEGGMGLAPVAGALIPLIAAGLLAAGSGGGGSNTTGPARTR